jgi:hypothetical protein
MADTRSTNTAGSTPWASGEDVGGRYVVSLTNQSYR